MDPTEFADLVPRSIYERSGSVFYSGRAAFSEPSPLYILGLNPGGSPTGQADETVGRHLASWQKLPERWSAYKDDIWRGMSAGTCGMQPRVLHMFKKLELNPHEVPASNVVFVRSNREAALAEEKNGLLAQCWPVHHAVIETLGVTTILCFGGTAGRWVRGLLGADEKVGEFVETNARRWRSEAHSSRAGVAVVTATHPSIADWRNPVADPTSLIQAALSR
jgi:hypothetical protein